MRKHIFKKVLACITGVSLILTPVQVNASNDNNSVNSKAQTILGECFNYGVIANSVDLASDFESNALTIELKNKRYMNEKYAGSTVIADSIAVAAAHNKVLNNLKPYSSYDLVYKEVKDMNNFYIDITSIDKNVVSVQLPQYVYKNIQEGGLKVKKTDSQVLIIHFTDITTTPVISRYSINNTSSAQDGQIKNTSSVIWTFDNYNGEIGLKEFNGICVAPNASIKVLSTCRGWVLCNTFTNPCGEWHYSIIKDNVETTTIIAETTTKIEESSSNFETAEQTTVEEITTKIIPTKEETTVSNETTTTEKIKESSTIEETTTVEIEEETTTITIEDETIPQAVESTVAETTINPPESTSAAITIDIDDEIPLVNGEEKPVVTGINFNIGILLMLMVLSLIILYISLRRAE